MLSLLRCVVLKVVDREKEQSVPPGAPLSTRRSESNVFFPNTSVCCTELVQVVLLYLTQLDSTKYKVAGTKPLWEK